MKRMLTILIVSLLVACFALPVQASIFPLVQGVNNRINFENWEYWIPGDGDSDRTTLAVGDRYHGVLVAQNISLNYAQGTIQETLSAGNGLFGVFEVQVYAINTYDAGVLGTFQELVMGPSTSGWQGNLGLSADALMGFWNHPSLAATNFDPGLGTDASVEGQFLDGNESFIGSVGFQAAWAATLVTANGLTTADHSLGYFLSAADPNLGIVPPAGGSEFAYGMFALDGPLADLASIGWIAQQVGVWIPRPTIPSTVGIFQAGYGFDLVGKGSVTTEDEGHYSIYSNDPANIHTLVPEPASMLIWCGAGAIGWVAVRRRRRVA